jgi:enterochelin esterase-like enzyme
MLRGTVERLRMKGASLTGNALGDPDERELLVYLPYGYADSARRYPVVMVLAGFAATNGSLLNFKPWEPNLLERYERLLAEGCGEAILVLPDCFTRLGGSQYLDSPAVGDYQRYLADDVVSFVDARFRTLPEREARAIIGKSSGGFGALRMGMDRPERFAVVGSHAGDCAFELSIRPRFAEAAVVYERSGGARAFLAELASRAPRSQAEFHALELLALAHVYAPTRDGDGPFGELPFDPRTAMVRPEPWGRWLAHDPLVRAQRGEHGLTKAQLVFLDAGKSDEYGLQFGARMLAEHLMQSGVAVEHEEFEGGHMGTAHRYDVSLPKVIAALAPAAPARGALPPAERATSDESVRESGSSPSRAHSAPTMREPL